ncbi:MAG TPA: enoyl-CoA hydratase/isomerase family protein [Burkholderiaceae bacterium]|jgi:enoyl-CoA hydratase|nr:enoyl-CoA hydratase/isomerase family protein [Burkholderiaceae bacterium]
MSAALVAVSDHDRVRSIRLQRADKINALNAAMMVEIAQAVATADDASLDAIVLTGEGPRGFCAGADIGEFAQGEAMLVRQEHALVAMIDAFALTPLPVLLLAHGRTLGAGGTLMTLADVVIAADDLAFGFPEIRFGMYPAIVHGTLMYKLSAAQAAQLSYSGRSLGAQQAQDLGLVTQVVPRAEIDAGGGPWLAYYLERRMAMAIGKRAWVQSRAGAQLSARVHALAPLMVENFRDAAVQGMVERMFGPARS